MTDVDELPEQVTVSMQLSNAPVAVPGSRTDTCLECGEDVVVSPATRQSIQAGVYPDYIVCLQCAAAEADEEEVDDAGE